MKRFEQRAVVALTAALALSLSGCGGESASSAVDADCKPEHIVKTVRDGVLTVASPDIAPVASVQDGEFTGSEADLVKKFAARNCLEVKAEKVSFAGAVPAVQSARADLAVGGFYRTAERAKVVGMSDPLYVDRLGAVSTEGLDTIESMIGSKVGTVDGYLWVPDAKKLFGDDLTVYPSNVEMQADLRAGRIDVALDSYGAAQALYDGDTKYQIVPLASDERITATIEPAQIGFPFTLDNKSLADALNATITDWRADGTIVDTIEEYGGDKSLAEVGAPRLIQ